MNYAKIKNMDIANGTGLRVSLFVSGCPHHCVGCFNPETWDWDYGEPFTQEIEDKIIELLKPNYIAGLSLLGGEPLAQDNTLLEFVKMVKATYPNKNIWCYTGYAYEDVKDNELLKYIDVLVDGPFILEQKDARLKFRGSKNQRILVLSEMLNNRLCMQNK